ncbi:interferon regulatory factor 1b [Takifugu rubripes]|uniref:Interferon regulatory factor n=1 Tax=Takifugu rubripes TaxID=31033 RepID=H2SCV7_TAKRU|nr:interferon regulatory factor 1 [Takifugu rubripes]|eukprot:XP_003971055.2 PREDICTED: interferon regulatory factor 1 isoform X1 [Takifugu rubripes]
MNGSHKESQQANMPVSRLRMRPWLERMINSDTIEGLKWVDQAKTMFSIPWKHAARHGWEIEKDANLFRMWAIHTGKYVEGQANDPKTWKANFRCAMNSLPDITEVKTMSVNKGHQAVRVFKMLPAVSKCKDKRRKAKEVRKRKRVVLKTEEDTEDSSDAQSSTDELTTQDLSPQDNVVDSTVKTEQPELRFDPQEEVPDFSLSVEVTDFNLTNFCQRFEVSPEHSSEDEAANIIELCKELERDSWLTNSSYGSSSGFLTNEACTSPGSQWSESSSGEDLEEVPQYTILGTEFSSDLWSCFSSQLHHML